MHGPTPLDVLRQHVVLCMSHNMGCHDTSQVPRSDTRAGAAATAQRTHAARPAVSAMGASKRIAPSLYIVASVTHLRVARVWVHADGHRRQGRRDKQHPPTIDAHVGVSFRRVWAFSTKRE